MRERRSIKERVAQFRVAGQRKLRGRRGSEFFADASLAGVVHLGKIAVAIGRFAVRNPFRARLGRALRFAFWLFFQLRSGWPSL
jgi:hypothetical protein